MNKIMCNDKQTIHFCTILSAEQCTFLLDSKSSVDRQKCLYRLMTGAVRTKTSYTIKGIEINLKVGQTAASDVELARYLGCNRKSVGKLIDSLNKLGMLTTESNNRTSIHTLHFLTGWYVDGVLITNPYYVKPPAIPKGQTVNLRTAYSDDLEMLNKPCARPYNNQSQKRNGVSMDKKSAYLSPTLSPSASSDHPTERMDTDLLAEDKNGYPIIRNKEYRLPDRDSAENRKETKNGNTDNCSHLSTLKREQ